MNLYRKKTRWVVRFKDHDGVWRRICAFSDKAASTILGRRIDRLVSTRILREQPDPELAKALESIPERIKVRLAAWGIISASAVSPLASLVSQYADYLRDGGNTPEHVTKVEARITRLIEKTRARTLSDLTAAAVHRALADLRGKDGLSAQTSNHDLTAAKSFFYWLVEHGRMATNPLLQLAKLNVQPDRRRMRRALSIEQIQGLLSATEAGPVLRGMSGRDRRTIYMLAITTGLRQNEIRHLKVADFHLDDTPPFVWVEALNAKNRKGVRLALVPEVIALMREHLRGHDPAERAFPSMPGRDRRGDVVNALKVDLKAAGIEYEEGGRVFDFHALRGQCATFLARAGVHPSVAQAILRHSDIRLTLQTYTFTVVEDQASAVQKAMPALMPSVARTRQGGGTQSA